MVMHTFSSIQYISYLAARLKSDGELCVQGINVTHQTPPPSLPPPHSFFLFFFVWVCGNKSSRTVA